MWKKKKTVFLDELDTVGCIILHWKAFSIQRISMWKNKRIMNAITCIIIYSLVTILVYILFNVPVTISKYLCHSLVQLLHLPRCLHCTRSALIYRIYIAPVSQILHPSPFVSKEEETSYHAIKSSNNTRGDFEETPLLLPYLNLASHI
jgi:hypothetical protein